MQALKNIRLGLRSCNGPPRDANRAFNSQGCRSLKTDLTANERATETIEIPLRIQRGPTDILKALSGTLSRDTTAPHYKYLDDPFLSPMSNAGKRNFAMAKESGRKAAKWIRAEHLQVFETAEKPQVEESDEAALNRAVQDIRVGDALTIFRRLLDNKQDVSELTKQSLLELVCFHNAEQPLDEDLIEERWFRQGARSKEREHKTWKDGGAAEAVFAWLSPPTAAAHSALVAGMTRFAQADRAREAMHAAGDLTLAAAAYDGMIRAAVFLAESPDLRWKIVTDLLTEMSSRGVQPTILTLNSALETLASMRQHRPARSLALLTLAEFRRIDIEPSLASFYHLIVIFSRDRAPSTLLSEILSYVEGKAFEMRDVNDAKFFAAAMEACRQKREVGLAHRLHAVLLTADNQRLIGDSFRESVYYRHYFALVCTSEPLDVFLAFYDKLVPNVYTPEPGVMEEVLRALEANGAADEYPRIWSDMRTFDHADRENLLSALLAGMVRTQRPGDQELAEKFSTVAGEVWDRLETPREGRYNALEWTGSLLGDVLTLFSRANDLDRSARALARLSTVPGVPELEALEATMHAAVQGGQHELALATVEFAAGAGFPEAGRLGAVLGATVPLDEGRLARLEAAVGRDALGLDGKDKAADVEGLSKSTK